MSYIFGDKRYFTPMNLMNAHLNFVECLFGYGYWIQCSLTVLKLRGKENATLPFSYGMDTAI